MRAVFLLVLLACACLASCRTARCKTMDTRCRGYVAEICDANGLWHRVADCAELSSYSGSIWECMKVPNGHACVKGTDAGGADARTDR